MSYHHIIFLHNIHTLLVHWVRFKDKEQDKEQENAQGVFYDGFMLDLCQLFYVEVGNNQELHA